MNRRPLTHGFTLIELIIGIVVLGIAAVGIMTALGRTTTLNVDPLLRAQSLALAQSFLDEAGGKPFYPQDLDPRFDTEPEAPINPCDPAEQPDLTTLPDASRSVLLTYVCAYDGYAASTHEAGLMTPDGNPIEGLDGYDVRVSVSRDSAGGITGALDPDCVLRVTVEAADPSGTTTRLHAFRTSGWEDCA